MVRDPILDIYTRLITKWNEGVFGGSAVRCGFCNPKARGSESCLRQPFFFPLNII